MQLFNLSGVHKIRPAWNYSVRGAIWQIRPAGGGLLLGEERRIEEKKALFFCLDRKSGQELWQNASPGDDWWVGIEAVGRDTVLFHGFATPELPQHRGVIAVDLLTGKKLWEDPQLEFAAAGNDSVVGWREMPAGKTFVELDGRSGVLRRDLDAADIRELKQEWLPPAEAGEVKFPLPLEQLAADGPELAAAIRGHYDIGTLAGPVEAVEQGGFIIFDYHNLSSQGTAQDPLFLNVIKVVERVSGTLVYSDTVTTGIRAVVPELFFVQHDMLYYIKERRTLTAVRLAS